MTMLEQLAFPRRVDASGAVVPKGWRTRLYQRVFERGWSLPWFMTAAGCHRYWDVPAGLENRIDRPEDYATGPVGAMTHVLRTIEPWVGKDEAVLEIGCNAGSKLNEMRRAGYTNLSGLELNAACFPVMERHFPELYQMARLHAGPVEQVLPTVAANSFGLVFSISSLSLIHPSQAATFEHIARVCGNVLVTLELEWAAGRHFFPRNYRRVFGRLGFEQMSATLITKAVCPQPELAAYWGHVLRLLRKVSV